MTAARVLYRNGLLVLQVSEHQVVPAASVPWGSGWLEFDPFDDWSLRLVAIDPNEVTVADLGAVLGSSPELRLDVQPDGSEITISQQVLQRKFAGVARARWMPSWDTHVRPSQRDDLSAAEAWWNCGHQWRAYQCFDGSTRYALDLLRWAADRALPEVVTERIRRTGQSAVEALGPAHEAHGDLVRALSLLSSGAETPIDVVDLQNRITEHAGLLSLHLGGLRAADEVALFHRRLIRVKSSSKGSWSEPEKEEIDWHLVHPSISATLGHEFSWTRRGRDIEVAVHLAGSAKVPSLIARAGDRKTGAVVAESPLVPRGDGLGASLRLPSAPTGRVAVDLAEPAVRKPIGVGQEKAVRRAQRRAIRAVVEGHRIRIIRDLAAAEVDSWWAAGPARTDLREAMDLWPKKDAQAISRLRDRLFGKRSRYAVEPGWEVPPALSELLAVCDEAGWGPP